MGDRNLKAQLGARVPQQVRDLAVEAAKRAGVSLNEWIEQAILAHVGDLRLPIVPHPDQVSLDDPEERLLRGESVDEVHVHTPEQIEQFAGLPVIVDERMPEGAIAVVTTYKKFDSDCRNGEYHWKNGAGNPCRFCGGETL